MTSRTPEHSTASLRELAENRSLPAHQVMDQDTLTWIARNRPEASAAPPTLPHPPLMLVPNATWFAQPQLVDSIHGIRHNARVSLLAGLLAQEYGLDSDHTAALCAAAAVHDCRRRDDRDDPAHGRRAALWFTRNQPAVATMLGRELPPHLSQQAAAAIGLHDVPYADFTSQQNLTYQRAPHLIDLLKAADCLDRYRLPLARWWPDPSHLRIVIPAWLHPVAFDLVVRSEQARLNGATNCGALIHASQILNPRQ
ncbi:hypothetical protein [Kitasatospora sp. MBT63]|uniref:hypothetical protein n=1 Tax=Kitasatospora sp. MBT63 TaxID=1444768 RepID=UPI000689CB47|nr:hypothetical protein [Kitasatospora sp. MBT63]